MFREGRGSDGELWRLGAECVERNVERAKRNLRTLDSYGPCVSSAVEDACSAGDPAVEIIYSVNCLEPEMVLWGYASSVGECFFLLILNGGEDTPAVIMRDGLPCFGKCKFSPRMMDYVLAAVPGALAFYPDCPYKVYTVFRTTSGGYYDLSSRRMLDTTTWRLERTEMMYRGAIQLASVLGRLMDGKVTRLEVCRQLSVFAERKRMEVWNHETFLKLACDFIDGMGPVKHPPLPRDVEPQPDLDELKRTWKHQLNVMAQTNVILASSHTQPQPSPSSTTPPNSTEQPPTDSDVIAKQPPADTEDIATCDICMDRQKNRLLVGCTHTVCDVCLPGLQGKCPHCRAPITKVVPFRL